MKIDDSIKSATGLPTGSVAGKNNSKPTEKALAAPTAQDNVHLTMPRQVADAAGRSTGVFDSAKVDKIKAAIASGAFEVDIEKVADGLLESVKDSLNARKEN